MSSGLIYSKTIKQLKIGISLKIFIITNLHDLLKEPVEETFSIGMESSSKVGASVRFISKKKKKKKKKKNNSSQSLSLNAWAKLFNRFTAFMSVNFQIAQLD